MLESSTSKHLQESRGVIRSRDGPPTKSIDIGSPYVLTQSSPGSPKYAYLGTNESFPFILSVELFDE